MLTKYVLFSGHMNMMTVTVCAKRMNNIDEMDENWHILAHLYVRESLTNFSKTARPIELKLSMNDHSYGFSKALTEFDFKHDQLYFF